MTAQLQRITLEQWDQRYAQLRATGMREGDYGGPLARHVEDGDSRLGKLRFDDSAAALRLWNFLLTEDQRLAKTRKQGQKLVAVMKDLGTAAVLAWSLPGVAAFYPDGAWWTPCIMELHDGLLHIADALGIDESFCPVRAMLGAFVNKAHFPMPDLLVCSTGATCDDFSAIAQRLEDLEFRVFWWEIPHRRRPDPRAAAVVLPGGFVAPREQVNFVRNELERIREELESLSGETLDDDRLIAGIRKANEIRRILGELRRLCYAGPLCPLPALEMLIAEMLAIHFCSDRDECRAVLTELRDEVERRVRHGQSVLSPDAVRVFCVNPVADLRVMNLLEDCGGRVCGTDYLFYHALDEIPEDLPPMEALARMALADPMVGSSADRAERIGREIEAFAAEAVLIFRIPGASHCAVEGAIIGDDVRRRHGLPVAEVEIPPITDALQPTVRTRLEGLMETARGRRK